MHNDLIGQFEGYQTAQEMWNALKLAFVGISTTRLRALTLKFETYKMASNAKMVDHLRKMSAMIRDLKTTGNNLLDEHQILAVLCSLPDSWNQMKLTMTNNESIKTFAQLSHHLELEVERQEAKGNASMFVAESSDRKGFKSKCKRQDKANQDRDGESRKRKRGGKHRKGKRGGKKDKSKLKCYNCKKLGHFTSECTDLKKVQTNLYSQLDCFVYSHVLVAHSLPN
ncbi:hypothetical protein RJ640_012257 [Escallonia rubra]|uniref:CCHC-type domain-containing protein n=1 Tax=Escallonia rubra TaxID=112253 RepID=A0AA88RT04_9ASTE|nr:hypothetical protein RJ640_012257 [Escallonia rubra]